MRNVFVLIISLWLTSCAGLTYQEPLTGPRARIRFVTDTQEITVLRTYDDVGCTQNETEWMRLRVGFLFSGTPKTLGMPLAKYHENSAKEVFVAADKQINGLFIGSETPFTISPIITSHLCGVPFFYTFSENKDYEVSFGWDRTQCRVVISQLIGDDNSGHALSEVARFSNRINEANKGCMAQFKKMRLY